MRAALLMSVLLLAACGGPSFGEPQSLAKLHDVPAGLAADGSRVFWTGAQGVYTSGGTSTPRSFGAASNPTAITAAGGQVYWGDENGLRHRPADESAQDWPVSAMPDSTSGAAFISDIAATGDTLVASVIDEPAGVADRVLSLPVARQGASLEAPESQVRAVAVCGVTVYWASEATGLVRATVDFLERAVFVPGEQGAAAAIVCDRTHVYWKAGSRIFRATRDEGRPTELAELLGEHDGFAQDEGYLYWTSPADGTVRRIRKSGGEAEVVAQGQHRPRSVAVTDSHIFWVTEPNGGLPGDVMVLEQP